jgi:hypothetical protein
MTSSRGVPLALAHSVAGQPVQAPLVTVVGGFLYLVTGGPSVTASYAAELVAYFWIVVVVFLIARGLAGEGAGLVAAFLAGSAPIVLDYVHEYSFAVPASAALATAVWAGLRSRQMTSPRWAALWGIALGAMVLSRTMTIAFLPSFLALATIHVFTSGRVLRSLAGVGVGGAAGFVIAGPWYLVQGGSVLTYLTSYGFGAQAALYGREHSSLSLTSWIDFVQDNVNAYLWLPLALVILSGLLALGVQGVVAVRRTWPGSARRALSSPWFYVSVVLVEGIVALEVSRNTGSAFLAPLVPIMVALSVAALFRWGRGRAVQTAIVVAALLVGVSAWFAKTALNGPDGHLVRVSLPGIGQTTVIDGRSEFDIYEAGETKPTDAKGVQWVAANQTLLNRIRQISDDSPAVPLVTFATNSRMLNVNTLRLDQALDGGREVDVALLSTAAGDDAASYAAQLHRSQSRDTFLVMRFASRGEFPPHVDQRAALRAAETLGFHGAASVALPDGTSLAIWRR